MRNKYTIKPFFVIFAISILTSGGFPSTSIAADMSSFLPSSLYLRWDGGEEKINDSTIGRWMNQKNELSHEKGYSSEIENVKACPGDKQVFCDLLLSSRERHEFKLMSQFEIDEGSVSAFLSNLAKKIDTDSADAKFSIENGKVQIFSPEKTGRKLDITSSTAKIIQALSENDQKQESVELVVIVSKPAISTSEINSLGIATLIGQGKSNFRGSTRSRIHNIKTAIQNFNGVLIKPGEEFSFVQTLGDVDGEHGYLPELVIKKDKTEPEFGGGICQVSTTTFRAAIYSGLKITARKNHAYPVSYYNPQGMDSTIYVPKPDLKFINNTPGHILIQTRIEGSELFFDFYGTDDGRKTEVDGPKILVHNPDGSMKTTFTQKVTDSQGNIIIEDIFNSSYDSPDKYPHPIDPSKITEKPKDWSNKQWENFKKTGLLPTN